MLSFYSHDAIETFLRNTSIISFDDFPLQHFDFVPEGKSYLKEMNEIDKNTLIDLI